MSESLKVAGTERYEAWSKAGRAIVPAEAGRQRGTTDPRGPSDLNAETQVQMNSEARSSIVRLTRSNAVSGGVEPVVKWRRQFLPNRNSDRPAGLPGVAGWTCVEGCSREDGRSGERVAASVYESVCVSAAISVTREARHKAPPEVGEIHSSNEFPVTGRDAKGSHLDEAAGEAKEIPIRGSVGYG